MNSHPSSGCSLSAVNMAVMGRGKCMREVRGARAQFNRR